MTDLSRDYPPTAVPWWSTDHPDDRRPYYDDAPDGITRSEETDRSEADCLPVGERHRPLNSARRWKEQAARLADLRAELTACCPDGYTRCSRAMPMTTWYVPVDTGLGMLAEVPAGARLMVSDGTVLVYGTVVLP